MRDDDGSENLQRLQTELRNFQEIADCLRPQPEELPRLRGIDVFGGTYSVAGIGGGDHIIYLDFKQRYDLDARIRAALHGGRTDLVENLRWCQRAAGIAVVDAAGHRATDGLLVAMLHQSFLLGAMYELDLSGRITGRLFEHLNARFHASSGEHKFVSMMYGEIAEDATFRFISAANPVPLVFSHRHDRFMDVGEEHCISCPPLGLLASRQAVDRSRSASMLEFKEPFAVNEWALMGAGDILLLYTDGLAEHSAGDVPYFSDGLERAVRAVKDRSARDIFEAVRDDVHAFGEPSDDFSLVVVKRV